jgi:hypothetical protein
MRVHPAFFHEEAITVKNRFLAMLLAMFTIVSLAACGQKSDAAINEINTFISENLSVDITGDEYYECAVSAGSEKNIYNVSLTLNLTSEGMSDDDLFDITAFESSYLIDNALANAPYAIDYTLNYLKDGKAFATVTRLHNSKEFIRDYNGTQDVFQFQL